MTESVDLTSEMPEIIFHRALTQPGSPYPKGKQNIEYLPDYKRQLFQDLYDHMNLRFDEQSEGLRLGIKPKLHFDFIDSDKPNALAFKAHEYAMVGATRGLLDHLVLFSGRLSHEPNFAIAFNLQAISPAALDAFLVLLFSLSLQFLASHELGHHAHGHVELGAASGVPFFQEFVDSTGAENNIDLQAMEIDADAYAVSIQLPNMLGNQRFEIARSLGMTVPEVPPRTILSLFLATIMCFLHSNPQKRYTGNSIQTLRHPPRVIRLDYIIGNIQRWCSNNVPELRAWPEKEEFRKMAQVVVDCSGVAAEGMSLAEEDTFITSALGKNHIRKLDVALGEVRQLMKPYSWRLPRSLDR